MSSNLKADITNYLSSSRSSLLLATQNASSTSTLKSHLSLANLNMLASSVSASSMRNSFFTSTLVSKLPAMLSPNTQSDSPKLVDSCTESASVEPPGPKVNISLKKSAPQSHSDRPSSCHSLAWLPALSRQQRLVGFLACLVVSGICFTLAAMCLPVFIFVVRKFGLLFTTGSICAFASFALLWGPADYVARTCFDKRQAPFTFVYSLSVCLTLYTAVIVRSHIWTAIACVVQMITLVQFVVSHLPGGPSGFSFLVRNMCCRSQTTTALLLPR